MPSVVVDETVLVPSANYIFSSCNQIQGQQMEFNTKADVL